MRHRKRTLKLGRRSEHRKSMLANLVSSLILEGRVKTTRKKAKITSSLAEKAVTLGKKGGLHHRRLAISRLRHKEAVRQLFAEIAPRYLERNGGYTRIIPLGPRVGDAAEMVLLEWVEAGTPAARTSKPAPAAPAAEPVEEVAEEAAVEEVEAVEEEVEETSEEQAAAEEPAEDADEEKKAE